MVDLTILTNIPTPYRSALFNSIAKYWHERAKSFHVLYCAKTEEGRHWPFDKLNIEHPHTFLRGAHVNTRFGTFHLNLGVGRAIQYHGAHLLLVAGSWNMPTAILSLASTARSQTKRIFWSEGHPDAVIHPKGLVRRIRRKVLSSFDAFAVPNARSGEWTNKESGVAKPTLHLPNAIDTQFYARPLKESITDIRNKYGIPLNSRAFVQVSNITERKGVRDLTSAFQELARHTDRKTCLVLVGTGPLAAELARHPLAAEGKLILLGQRAAEEIREILHSCDVFVLNTHRDPNPLAPIEAASAGLPLLLSKKAGNFQELVNEPGAGIGIDDPMDPLPELIKFAQADVDHLKNLGAAAKLNVIKSFSVEYVTISLYDHLEKLESSWK